MTVEDESVEFGSGTAVFGLILGVFFASLVNWYSNETWMAIANETVEHLL